MSTPPLPPPTETEAIEPSIWYALLGLPFFLVGIFLATYSYYGALHQVAGSLTQIVVPGGVLIDLQPGQTYTLFQEKGSTVKGKSYSDWPQIDAMSCTLSKVSNSQPVELQSPKFTATYTSGTRAGKPLYEFVVPASGQYDFTCEKKGDTPPPDGVVAIGAGIGENMNKVLAHCRMALIVGCGLGLLIFLIVVVQRELSKRRIRAEGLRPV
ncbi:MAG TPA: hypothetical protein VMT75_12570 [Candidatus Saccharimonadales bacterium]|nr:hypothetical protein [Candidatus Saccharimonadales bacterium]